MVPLIESWATEIFEVTVKATTGIAITNIKPARMITTAAILTNHLVIGSNSIKGSIGRGVRA